jgi:AraC family transcriptional regulator
MVKETTHQVSYARLFGEWLCHSGRELRSEPSLEFYLNDPDATDPEDLLTDIAAPLEAVSRHVS